VTNIFIARGRWLKTLIPDIYAPLVNFVRLTAGKCKLFRDLVLYLWISLLVLNKYLLLIVYKSNEYMYWEYNVIIYIFLQISLQQYLGLVFVIILIIFFCNIKTLLAQEEPPQKIIP
jgi:hypothetical protein